MPTLTAPLPASSSSRFTLPLLAAVFILPFVVGSGLFWLGWRPDKFGNHGELLQPPRPLPEIGLRHIDGRPLPTSELRGKWLIVTPVRQSCDARCQTTLQQMHQVHVALNKEQGRAQRVLVVSGAAERISDADLAQLQRRFPDLVVATATGSAAHAWASTFDGQGQPVYLVDPLTNVMMHYADPVPMRDVLKDLERLLKYSWIR